MEILFIEQTIEPNQPLPPIPEPPEPPPTQQQASPKPIKPTPITSKPSKPERTNKPTTNQQSTLQAVTSNLTPSSKPRLFAQDGQLMLEKTDLPMAADDDRRQFSYQHPNRNQGSKVFDRPSALEHRETIFDEGFQPTQDAFSEAFDKLGRALVKKVTIPYVGGRMECTISVLGVGSCWPVPNDLTYSPGKDDPNTLNLEEQLECADWWEQIQAAKSQSIWLATRKLYDEHCRKPNQQPAIP